MNIGGVLGICLCCVIEFFVKLLLVIVWLLGLGIFIMFVKFFLMFFKDGFIGIGSILNLDIMKELSLLIFWMFFFNGVEFLVCLLFLNKDMRFLELFVWFVVNLFFVIFYWCL